MAPAPPVSRSGAPRTQIRSVIIFSSSRRRTPGLEGGARRVSVRDAHDADSLALSNAHRATGGRRDIGCHAIRDAAVGKQDVVRDHLAPLLPVLTPASVSVVIDHVRVIHRASRAEPREPASLYATPNSHRWRARHALRLR